jgi:hypothetical protein
MVAREWLAWYGNRAQRPRSPHSVSWPSKLRNYVPCLRERAVPDHRDSQLQGSSHPPDPASTVA